ncbi:unnamed protein product [Aspergillus oryzae RIB40]|uniref:DNA, SC113 n=1 Tax=Aspergillus oryzae (strain ATCC 42149 / RIB 40) TaxID=510516 RepID=Q2U6H3_ASPOR|nr:unnamed protein product [Aspergillus oryzae RIB40]BAE62842.1 unnamed protein product [Aspergillus oryzae RIB40]
MTFQTTRPSSTLLVPSKRPLSAPRNPTLSNTTATYPPIHIRSTSTSTSTPAVAESKSKSKSISENQHVELNSRPTTVEYDFSSGPQPFLDPALWENVKAVDRLRREGEGLGEGDVYVKEKEEELRREREREAEFGGMAVRGRMGRWK